jgi:hypothetical protein
MRRSASFKNITLVACVALLLGATSLVAQERWFHVHVTEGGSDPVKVSVNLPLSLIEQAVKLVPEEVDEEMQMELNDVGIDIDDLRAFWKEVRNSDDATFVTVESEDETVRVSKEGDFLIARTVTRSSEGAEVDVRFPFEVLDALFSGPEEQIDLAAAIRALAEFGDGDMVSVREGDTRVRVWVDDVNESEPAI